MDKRYLIIGVGVLLVIVLGITLLVSGKGKTKTVSDKTLVIWNSFDKEDNFARAINHFKDAHPDYKVQYVKKNPATYETDSLNAIAAGNGPDIWVVPSTWMPKHHSKMAAMPEKSLDSQGKLANDAAYKNIYLPVAYKDNVYDNQVYGIPLFMDSLSLFYNQNAVSRRYDQYVQEHENADLSSIQPLFTNSPQTWDDLLNLIKYYGPNAIALGASNIENPGDVLTALMLQYGAQMNSEDKSNALFHTSTNLISETPYPGAKALTFFTSFARKGESNYSWDAGEKSAYESFVQGNVAMMIGYNQLSEELTKDMGDQFQVKPLPQIKKTSTPSDLAYYQIMTVPENAARSAAAWVFIKEFISSDAQIDVEYLNTTRLASPKLTETKTSSDWLDIQNLSATSWYNPDPIKVSKILTNAIDQSLAGQNAQTVVEGAAAQITSLLADLKGTK